MEKGSPPNSSSYTNLNAAIEQGNLDTAELKSEDIKIDEPLTIVYENSNLLFSSIQERGFRMALVWKPWTTRVIKIFSNGVLTNARPSRPGYVPQHHKYIITEIDVTVIENDASGNDDFVGLKVKCLTMDKIETYFRCVASAEEINRFLDALKSIAIKHNIGNHVRTALHVPQKKTNRFITAFIPGYGSSVMRRAVGRAMDIHDKRSRKERILAKRGTMKWLPVLGANDLIHGSW
jgi:hypothetical protein